MRLGVAVDYGKYANSSSLNLIARKMFSEWGKLMNKRKDFTVTALLYENIGIGNVNQHYDCISVPNMGGYKFPHARALTSNNLVIGLSGIDEVVLGQQVYKNKTDYEKNKILIEKEVPKWSKFSGSISFVHVPSESDKKQMMQYLKIPEEKLHVIYHGVDHDKFKPLAGKENERRRILAKFYMNDSPYFIHISESNWARKNIFRMLEAYDKARKNGIPHKLLIVGRADPVVYEKANSIEGVKVLGFVSEEHLVKLVQCSDALIYPSLHEGFGLPLAEAMACGVPAVTSNVYSPPEIVGDAGLFVDPYDTQDIRDKIVEMSTNDSLRAELSKKAIERSKQFNWDDTASKLLDLIRGKTKSSKDFAQSYDIAAYRTLTTVCQMTPKLYDIAVKDLLEFDYTRIISWAAEEGLQDPNVKDFLAPFQEWILAHE